MLMKHTENDGDLSIFAKGDQVLIACNKGCYWIFTAKQQRRVGSFKIQGRNRDMIHDKFGSDAADSGWSLRMT